MAHRPVTDVVSRVASRVRELDPSFREDDVFEAVRGYFKRWPGLAAVPDDASLPFELALKHWWPDASSDAARTIGFDAEIDGIACGARLAGLKENIPAARAAALVRAYGAMGFAVEVVQHHARSTANEEHHRGDDFAVIAIARDAETLADVVEAQRLVRPNSGDWGDDSAKIARIGERLGYPPCCVRAFAEQAGRGDNPENERLVFRRAPGARLSPLIARLGELRLVSHFPCSPDCAASTAAASAVLARLAAVAPEPADAVRRSLEQSVLWLDAGRRLRLRGSFDREQFVVSEASAIRGSFGDAGAARLPVDQIARVSLGRDGACFVLRDGRAVDVAGRFPILAIPGASLAPPALAALGGPLPQPPLARPVEPPPRPPATEPSEVPPLVLPPHVRVGTNVLTYRIVGIEHLGDEHRISLASATHRFDVSVRPDRPGRPWTLRRGRWALDVAAPETLPDPARAALGLLVRALPAG